MKALSIVIVTMLMIGCSTTQEPETVSGPVPVEITTPITVAVDNPETIEATGRIDASSFLKILVDSGCDVSKAEYKEVDRGAGISIACMPKAPAAQRSDPLSTDGIADL